MMIRTASLWILPESSVSFKAIDRLGIRVAIVEIADRPFSGWRDRQLAVLVTHAFYEEGGPSRAPLLCSN